MSFWGIQDKRNIGQNMAARTIAGHIFWAGIVLVICSSVCVDAELENSINEDKAARTIAGHAFWTGIVLMACGLVCVDAELE